MSTQAQPSQSTITQEVSLLDRIAEESARTATRYMPTLTVKQFTEREHMLIELKALLVEGIDYGKIPGAGDKPVLFKPGAEKLCAFFGYAPHYTSEVIEDWNGEKYGEPLFYYKYTCVLSKDAKPVGEGQGSCNSWETKYRYRLSKRTCPTCGKDALIEGKQWKPTDQKQWVCFEKKGGCKAKFDLNDKRITSQSIGQVKNPDFADTINTIQKMGQKRAMVAAVLSATGASQYFTQDIEDGATPDPVAQSGDKGDDRSNADATVPSTPDSNGAPRHEPELDPRPIPEELKDAVAKIRLGDLAVLTTVDNFLKAEIVSSCGTDAPYIKETERFRRQYPKGKKFPYEAVVSLWLDLFAIIEAGRFVDAVNPE